MSSFAVISLDSRPAPADTSLVVKCLHNCAEKSIVFSASMHYSTVNTISCDKKLTLSQILTFLLLIYFKIVLAI